MVWVIGLLCLFGVFLVGLEAIVPGGILGIMGWVAIGISAYFCFRTYGQGAGVAYLIGTSAGAVVFWLLAFKFLLPKMSLEPFAAGDGEAVSSPDARIGREAVVIEDLDPTGYVRLDGQRVPAHSESSFEEVGVGARVRVVDVDSTYLVCRPVEAGQEGSD